MDQTPAEGVAVVDERPRETEAEAEIRRAHEQDEIAAQTAASAAVHADLLNLFGSADDASPLGDGKVTELSIRLICAWTLGKPENADDTIVGLAALTVRSLLRITGGK
jgi:hypothetical protein